MLHEKHAGPFIPANQTIPEFTIKAVVLGCVLGVVLGAANAYLGLYVGMTVSASIPAAVVSMGILRGLLKTGTILENNMVQTVASTGEALSAGIVFTIPAMILSGVWTEIHFWPTTLICITGGLLGVLFMIPLRKSHIVKDETLSYPEGTACAEVLIAGEKGGAGLGYLLGSIILGGTLKFFIGGISLFKDAVEGAWEVGRTAFYGGCNISAALLGVGYIVGLNIAVLVFAGGLIGWVVAVPILGLSTGVEGNPLEWFWSAWSSKVRYIGVGAMITGGIWSVVSMHKSVKAGIKEAFLARRKQVSQELLPRTEQNMPYKHVITLLAATTLAIFLICYYFSESPGVAAVSTFSTILLSFFFVAVASYVAGLIGQSNQPVSGMTICALLATGALLLLMDVSGQLAIVATLGVAGIVCCAAVCAGDLSQDLKTGHLLGATPKHQQWMQIIGVVVPAFFIAPVLVLLHKAYGIGDGLLAPQATLFASLVQGLFGKGTIPWDLVYIGILLAVPVILVDLYCQAKKFAFRAPVMAVAVGIYLPLTLSAPIALGGVIHALAHRRQSHKDQPKEKQAGILFASGLIAGESLMGILVAGLIYFGKGVFPIRALDSNLLSILALAAVGSLLYWVGKNKQNEGIARRD